MGSYFKSWRRTIGVVTLMLALVFTGGWVRSLSVMDVVLFGSGKYTMEHCVSVDHSLVWGRLRTDDSRSIIVFPVWETSGSSNLDAFLDRANLRCSWRRCGFGVGEMNAGPADRHTIWIIPYWSIVIPLTLLSAWLLLSKPRKATRTHAEPIPEKVT